MGLSILIGVDTKLYKSGGRGGGALQRPFVERVNIFCQFLEFRIANLAIASTFN